MSRATHPNQDGGDAGGKRMDDISADPSNPTTFQVNTSDPATCYYDEDCGGMSFAPDIVLEMDAAAAPESCGSFYWDPLLLAVDGDGQSASAPFDGQSASAPFDGHSASAPFPLLFIILIVVGVLALAGASICYMRKKKIIVTAEKKPGIEMKETSCT